MYGLYWSSITTNKQRFPMYSPKLVVVILVVCVLTSPVMAAELVDAGKGWGESRELRVKQEDGTEQPSGIWDINFDGGIWVVEGEHTFGFLVNFSMARDVLKRMHDAVKHVSDDTNHVTRDMCYKDSMKIIILGLSPKDEQAIPLDVSFTTDDSPKARDCSEFCVT